MSKLAIVTDSTAYIPENILSGYPITVAPLLVIWDDQSLKDGVDIMPADFYARLKESKTMPSTSQVTPATFLSIYKQLLDEGYEIISAHISSKLSGTLDSAIQAKEHFPGSRIELFDSLTSGMALGFQVLAAARAAEKGANIEGMPTSARERPQAKRSLFCSFNARISSPRGKNWRSIRLP